MVEIADVSARPKAYAGRGAAINPTNRFEKFTLERAPDWDPEQDPAPQTVFLRDNSESIITYNNSPDIPFNAGINPYRGCEHGCSYCYARISHEFLGFSAGLDFETKIVVKENAPALLRKELASKKWKPQLLAMSGVTDCYQPVERRLQLTRKCLAVLAEFKNPVCIITKNHLVTRDIDLLSELARYHAVEVNLSINSLDADLARRLEPRAASPRHRLAAVEALAQSGIPVGVLVAPIIPGLNDHEIANVLESAGQAGAVWAGMEILRLPLTVATVFEDWLTRNEPGKKDKVLDRIRSMRGGKLNDPRFGERMRGQGVRAEQIRQLFDVARRKARLAEDNPPLSTSSFRRPTGNQLELF